MKVLAPGENASLSRARCAWHLESEQGALFGEYAGVALLPVDGKRNPCGTPALLQCAQPWMQWSGGPERVACAVDLQDLPPGAERLLVLVYVYSAAGPVSEMRALRLVIDDALEHRVALAGQGDSAILIGEFYTRNDEWKFRALAEGSAYGLAALGRRMGIEVDDQHPLKRRPDSGSAGRCEAATGTGFAVTPQHILTCAHVIEGMRSIAIASFEGRYPAEPVVVDRRNDLALLRVDGARPLSPVTFRDGMGCELGESVIALGYPLAGLAGKGVHVTQGGVSGLFGLHDDASLLQFTAPIQPGSSGSPLFDGAGLVAGMVTSTMADAQNMNFALKSALVLAFLDASRVCVARERSGPALETTTIVRNAQASLWRIEASVHL